MEKRYSLFSSTGFLLGLSILLLNDFIWKNEYHNWLTGKLSDFSGLFVFALFWIVFFPQYRTKILWGIGLFFIYWKSAFSQPFIDSWNNILPFSIQRTVDPSDLLALVMLPLAFGYLRSGQHQPSLRLHPILPISVAAFAFMATSYRTDVDIQKAYQLPFPKDTLLTRLNSIDSLNYGYGIRFTNKNPDTITITLPSSFCFSNFEAIVCIQKITPETTHLTLLSAVHRCPKRKDEKEDLTEEFEEYIISKIFPGYKGI
ncbi:MAG TPA: hypothetical protein VK168_06235 [Saprospiraceae bacterium]|nr:hypothetical protein [Saprospiraceae bacterium]